VGYRWFNAVVILFWLATMTWLVIVKVLPPLQIGEPPNYRSVYKVERGEEPKPVCWDMLWNDRPMGWAETRVERTPAGVTEVRSLVHFDRVPVDELAPPWMRPALRRALDLAMDADSRLEIDPLGRLSSFRSNMRVIGHDAVIRIRGRVVGTTLTGTVETGGMIQPFDRYLPPDALMGDELSPQARMPGLRIGQEWTVPVYSPLRFSDNRNPVEILHAKVEGRESVVVGDESVLTLTVVYRSDSGSILGASQAPRGKLWVASDGTVLKQTTHLLGSQLTFFRAGSERSKDIVKLASERRDEIRRRWAQDRMPPPHKYAPSAPRQNNAADGEPREGGTGKRDR